MDPRDEPSEMELGHKGGWYQGYNEEKGKGKSKPKPLPDSDADVSENGSKNDSMTELSDSYILFNSVLQAQVPETFQSISCSLERGTMQDIFDGCDASMSGKENDPQDVQEAMDVEEEPEDAVMQSDSM